MARDRPGLWSGGLFQNRCFTSMGVHFGRIKAPDFQTFPDTLSGRSQGHFWFTFAVQVSLLDVFWGPLGAFGVSLAPSCESFGCLWLAWAVFGFSLVPFCVYRGSLSSILYVLCVCFVVM